MSALIEATALKSALELQQHRWKPGKPLRLLLAGYTGSRNTGSDIRPEEMIRQFRHIWGDDNLELSIFTMDRELTAGYFRAARQIELPMVYPLFLSQEVPKHHGVIGVEGSMFKSKFTNAVTIMIASAMGLAGVEGKVSVGYGGEAGAMDEDLADFVERQCKRSLVICRNEPSCDVLGKLGVRTKGGTDTAWTFRPNVARGAEVLKAHGWDGKKRVLGVGPINPFWWPVKPRLSKAVAYHLDGSFANEHYRSIYFHDWGAEAKSKYDRYVNAFTNLVARFQQRSDLFVFLFGMEKLDRKSCEDVASRLSVDPPVLVSDEYNMYELVGALQHCSLLVSSRFHALVTSMLGGVPSAGVTMDERITNLLTDRGHQDLLLTVDDPDLSEKLYDVTCRLEEKCEQVRADIERFIPNQLKMLGQMGIDLEDEVARIYPDLPRRNVARVWDNYLPEPAPSVQRMMERYA
jgi:polysaccharide pyruvyl transferase WcaK-like protein